ncbi:hypothetical protein [Mesorhizobium shangrilense]|uniref:Uncharacterized protein n=1 Tax=Mesorhizobium shangrilense TaxID=460060 RepID=A0ABV2DKA3_9HYPH
MIALSGLGLLARPEMDRSFLLSIPFSFLIWYYQFEVDVKRFLELGHHANQRKSCSIALFSFNFLTDRYREALPWPPHCSYRQVPAWKSGRKSGRTR